MSFNTSQPQVFTFGSQPQTTSSFVFSAPTGGHSCLTRNNPSDRQIASSRKTKNYRKVMAKFPMSSMATVKPESDTESKSANRLVKVMSNAFNNPTNSDLKFRLKKKGNEDLFDWIYVHKWILEENVEYFRRMFANHWKESESNEIEINGYSYEAYYGFLKFLYTDCIDTKEMDVLLEMLSIDDEYLEPTFKGRVIETIKQLANISNVCTVYSVAIRLNVKDLEEFCFKTIVSNHKLIVLSEDYKSMDSNIAKGLLTKVFQTYHQII